MTSNTHITSTNQDRSDTESLVRLALWGLISVAFVAFLAFGSVSVRIWRLGDLRIERKSLRGVWERAYEGLPRVEAQWLLNGVFLVSMAVFVVGGIVAMKLLLDAPDGPSAPRT